MLKDDLKLLWCHSQIHAITDFYPSGRLLLQRSFLWSVKRQTRCQIIQNFQLTTRCLRDHNFRETWCLLTRVGNWCFSLGREAEEFWENRSSAKIHGISSFNAQLWTSEKHPKDARRKIAAHIGETFWRQKDSSKKLRDHFFPKLFF